jgi:predicted Ser/Thr protein kinase
MTRSSALTRAELERLPRERLRGPFALKPSVWRVEASGGPLIVKDAREAGPLTRWIARWLVRRERGVLERLESVEEVPHVVSVIDSDAFAQTLLQGEPLDGPRFRLRPRDLAEQLRTLTSRLHERGVYHLDLHQRRNLLLDDGGRLRVVDFGAALAPGPVVRALFGWLLAYADEQATLKYLARFSPGLLSLGEARTVLRQRRLRKLWPFTRSGSKEARAAKARLRRG